MKRRLTAGPVRQLVMQPTPFCNLACTYCYLPHRNQKAIMPVEVVEATLHFIKNAGLLGQSLDIRWHAGEPLAVAKGFYEVAFDRIATAIGDSVDVSHSLQTNGVLLDAGWARLLAKRNVRVGVSIDGPAAIHDVRRLSRRGAGSFDRVMHGLAHLQALSVPFEVIAVVTHTTLRNAEAFRDFFATLPGLRELGLNIEESEGEHVSTTFVAPNLADELRRFLEDLSVWSARTGVSVRELRAMRERILFGVEETRNSQNEPLAIITIDVAGNVGTFSPELLGMTHRAYAQGFALGNVVDDPPEVILRSTRLYQLTDAIRAGKDACQATCAYYSLCGGGAPVNKLYENGSFASARTKYCESAVIAVADVVLAELEQ